jgi:hypothetical protein
MHYLDFGGSGPAPVIFLHGGHGDARKFEGCGGGVGPMSREPDRTR